MDSGGWGAGHEAGGCRLCPRPGVRGLPGEGKAWVLEKDPKGDARNRGIRNGGSFARCKWGVLGDLFGFAEELGLCRAGCG